MREEIQRINRVHRSIYTDAAIFEREMTHVFGAVWVYLAHESQIPHNDDFVTARLGLRPLVTDTLMRSPARAARLARTVLHALERPA